MNFRHLPIEMASHCRLRLRFCWRWLVIPFLMLCIWGWCDVRDRGFAHPEDPLQHKSDFTVYTEAGAAFFDGRPPYEVTNPRGWTYLYPPMFALLVAPLHALPSQDQVGIWFVISLLMCWGCFYECAKTLRFLCRQDDHVANSYTAWYPWLGIAAVMAAALPTFNCLQRGQVGVLKLYLLVLGLRLVITGRRPLVRLLGGIVLALPIVLKIVPLLPVSFVIFVQLVAWLTNRRRSRVRACTHANPEDNSARACEHATYGLHAPYGSGRSAASSPILTCSGLVLGLLLFLFVIPSILIGWRANLHHLKTWSTVVLVNYDDGGDDARSGNSHSMRNQSLQNAAYRLGNFIWHKTVGGPDDRLADFFERPKAIFTRPNMIMDSPPVEWSLLGIRIAILLVLGLVGIRLGLEGDALSLLTAFSLGAIAIFAVSPIARAHYFMLYAPAILYVPLWLDRQNRTRAAKIMAVVPILLTGLHYCFLSFTGRIGLLGIGTTAWLLSAFVLILRADRKAAATPEFAARHEDPPAIRQAA